MNPLSTEEPRYSLKTLKALHYGARCSGVSQRGIVRLTYLDTDGYVHNGKVLSVSDTGVYTHDDDGTLLTNLKPANIVHAEVV